MKRKFTGRYPGPAGMFALSLACHLVILLVIAKWQFFPEFRQDETPVTYVDMVTLPVESPQSGTPAPAARAAEPEPPRPVAVAPVPPSAAMSQPAKPAPVKPAKAKAPAPEKAGQPAPATDAVEFNERLARLERIAEDKRQAEVLERLRQGGKRTGMPGAKGNEAGSDYPSYLQSRLKDALRQVMVSQTKSPELFATITVAPDGRITEYRVEKRSGDPLFEDAVKRAVTLAGKSLAPPPDGAHFKHGFRFRPEEVGIR